MGLKTCSKCSTEKSLDEFYLQKGCAGGRRADCKQCVKDRQKQNPEHSAKLKREWRSNNKEKYLESNRKWHTKEENRRKWRAYQAHFQRQRALLKTNATPEWLTEDELQHIRCLYQVSAMRTRDSDDVWEVDHIVPLKGKTVCGLHVPWNLRVIPRSENRRKSNNFEG